MPPQQVNKKVILQVSFIITFYFGMPPSGIPTWWSKCACCPHLPSGGGTFASQTAGRSPNLKLHGSNSGGKRIFPAKVFRGGGSRLIGQRQ